MRTRHTSRPARPRAATLFLIPVALAAAATGAAQAASHCGPDGVQPGGAVYRVCMPDPGAWNGDLVIWAHGYVESVAPVAIPEEQLCLDDGFCLPDITNGLGFGFATTSYRMNGLVTTGVEDVAELIDLFAAEQGAPARVFVVGASEGGLVTTLAVEQRPDLFDGGLAACGPVGDFRRIVGYYGDFRVLFDYFFPGLMPGTPMSVPPDLLATWDDFWITTVRPAVFDPANADLLSQLLRVARAPHVMGDIPSIETTVHDALWYNVFATADLVGKIGGSPYDNMTRRYMGSADDVALNAAVARYAADPAALAYIDANLQTTGSLTVPLVNLHTTMDQQVGFVQELLYGQKLRATGSQALRILIPSFRYGHCNFKPWEALLGFALMVYRASGQAPAAAEAVLASEADRRAYREAAVLAGLPVAAERALPPPPAGVAPARAGGGTRPARSLDSP
jgi:pimeloyl-ACP methyl ester carboxylesterase